MSGKTWKLSLGVISLMVGLGGGYYYLFSRGAGRSGAEEKREHFGIAERVREEMGTIAEGSLDKDLDELDVELKQALEDLDDELVEPEVNWTW